MNVTAVKPHPKNEKWAFIAFDSGPDVWCPDREKAEALVIGQPLPADWTQDVGDYGPRAFPPKEKKGFGSGGPPAFRNTKEGFLMEQQSIHRSVALQRSVEACSRNGDDTLHILDVASAFYEWLSLSPASPIAVRHGEPIAAQEVAHPSLAPAAAGDNHSGGGEAGDVPSPSPEQQSVPLSSQEPISGDGGTQTLAHGEGAAAPSPPVPAHVHNWQPSPTMKTREVCPLPCGETRVKASA